MKVIIAGSRGMKDFGFLKETCERLLANVKVEEIVSGRCPCGNLTYVTKDGIEVYGADGLGEKYAELKGIPVKAFPGDWKNLGPKAGPLRNAEMAKYADALIAFKGNGPGTTSMINLAKKHKLKVKIINL